MSITDRGALLRVFIEHVCSSHVDPGRTKSNTVDNWYSKFTQLLNNVTSFLSFFINSFLKFTLSLNDLLHCIGCACAIL